MKEKDYFAQKLFFCPRVPIKNYPIYLKWKRNCESVTFLLFIVLFQYAISKFTVSKPKQAESTYLHGFAIKWS